MNSTLNVIVVVVGYVVAVLVCALGVICFLRIRRKTKWPFKESEKLLRGPGETLKRQIVAIDDNFDLTLCVGVSITFFILGFVGWILAKLGTATIIVSFSLTVVLVALATVNIWWLVRQWKRRANLLLGWFGERMTADYLLRLQREGYFVFHDLPAEPGKDGFNIDHVVVGPTGVAIVETKTRRKLKADGGHEVIFDGTKLVWPWGAERKSFQQAANEAEWLSRWLETRIGERPPVKKVLSIPGWYVHETPNPDIRVVNPKIIADVIKGSGAVTLTPKQIDLIARQLDQRCRDVDE